MDELNKYMSMWTSQKDLYIIKIIDDNFIITDKNNMMLYYEDDDINIKVLRAMIQNDVKVIRYNPQTGEEIIVPSDEALQEFDSVPRKDVKVKILWEADLPIYKQVSRLKKIYERFFQIPTVQLYKMACNNSEEWVFAEMNYKDAEDLLEKAQYNGIKLEIEVS